jgi:hypothetical protein
MEWQYGGLDELKLHIQAYHSEIDARSQHKVNKGEDEHAIEVELDDLERILKAARELSKKTCDPCDVDVLRPLRVDGKIRPNYYYLYQPLNGCRLVYYRNLLKSLVTPVFLYHVHNTRLTAARGMLELIKWG